MVWERFFREHKDVHEAISLALAERRIRMSEIQYPPDNQIYRAFSYNEPKDIKVVILGQDPYHGEGEANGLAFSVNRGVRVPPSLMNIYKELKNEFGYPIPNHGDLENWAKQGVLLLNTCLTVAKDRAGSHFDIGWEMLTDEVIKVMNEEDGIVFMLWGKKAQAKEHLLTNSENLVLRAPHPSPFSANTGFFGCGHFKKANEFLGDRKVDWKIV